MHALRISAIHTLPSQCFTQCWYTIHTHTHIVHIISELNWISIICRWIQVEVSYKKWRSNRSITIKIIKISNKPIRDLSPFLFFFGSGIKLRSNSFHRTITGIKFQESIDFTIANFFHSIFCLFVRVNIFYVYLHCSHCKRIQAFSLKCSQFYQNTKIKKRKITQNSCKTL